MAKFYRLFLGMAMIVCGIACSNAEPATLYAVGYFQNWSLNNASIFAYEDGVYKLDIDFTEYQKFKISTTNGDNWSDFDNGALQPVGNPQLNVPIGLKSGVDNITAPAAKPLTVIVNLDKMTITFSDGGDAPHAWSGTLPLMVINTKDYAPIVSKDDYLDAECYLDPLGLPGVKAMGSADEPVSLQIKGRGNYTWIGFEKKPYRLKFTDKQAPAGLDKSKHFVLLAHADDNLGFLRNETGFEISRLIGMPWTPATRPVEVVLNGDYIGLYFLTENIRVAKDRVNIVEQADLATNPEEITGGWLVEIDNYDTDPHVTVREYGDQNIWFTYKTPEVLSSEQDNWLTNNLTELNNRIYAGNYADATWSEMVDLDVLSRFYITQEITDNRESFHGSCYLNRERGTNSKWMFGPVWDFGNSFMNNTDEFIWHSVFHQVWIKEMCKYPQFMDIVKDNWKTFIGNNLPAITEYVNEFASKIADAATCDATRWPQYGNADIPARKEKYLNLLNKRVDFLRQQWGEPSVVATIQTPMTGAYAADGTLYITVSEACDINISSLTGITQRLHLNEGLNIINTLPKGFYIIEGRKIIL